MIYKIEPTSLLYSVYFRERYVNAQFYNSIMEYCNYMKCTPNDLEVKQITKDGKPSVTVSIKDKSMDPNNSIRRFDFAEGIGSDLDCVSKEKHATNINKYINYSQEPNEHHKQLAYEYFMLGLDLYIEIQDSPKPLTFFVNGIRKLTSVEEILISNIRSQITATNDVLAAL